MEVPVSKPDYSNIFSFTDDANLKSLGYGQSYQIKYSADEGATITWSSNSDIVSVDNNGMLKVNTLVGGDATITAEVKKGDISFKTTVDVTVAQGRFDFSFGEGLSPWKLDDKDYKCSVGNSDDEKTTVNLGQKGGSGSYRGDLLLENEFYLHAGNYKILAVKIALPSYKDNNTYDGAVTLDLVSENSGGAYKGGGNTYTILGTATAGDVAYLYFDLTQKFGTGDKVFNLSTSESFKATKLTFKIADFKNNPSPTTYDIYWVKTFASVEELTNYVNSENQTASN